MKKQKKIIKSCKTCKYCYNKVNCNYYKLTNCCCRNYSGWELNDKSKFEIKKNKIMSIEKIFNLLRELGLHPVKLSERVIQFYINDKFHYIIWYWNICTLSLYERYGNYIRFNTIKHDTCWPSYKNGLKFLDENNNCMIYLTIDKLDWQK